MIKTLTEQNAKEYTRELLQKVYLIGAADIHLERYQGYFHIRYRQASKLIELDRASEYLGDCVIKYIKTLAHLNLSAQTPQDGKIILIHKQTHIEMRVSVVPTELGESVVIRYLSNKQGSFSLNTIGIPQDQLSKVKEHLTAKSGLYLVTGPTGSGKTTTLYSALKYLNTPDVKIITAEDPVEQLIDGAVQVQVNESQGLGFIDALKTFLRQDPDIIMIGEIRDSETARIAVDAALSGHRVLTSLHTPDAVTSIARLTSLGIPSYKIAACLRMIISQDLHYSKDQKTNAHFDCLFITPISRKFIANKASMTELEAVFRE